MILITGASGFIGDALLNSIKGKVRVVSRRKHKFGKNVELLSGDITDKDFVSRAVKGVNKIIHMASIINPNDEDIFKVNIDATKYLVEEAVKNKVKKFVYLSSENVGEENKDNYATTKTEAEKIVKSFSNSVILRPTVVYGRGDEKYLGKIMKLSEKFPIVPILGSGQFQPIYIEDLVKCIVESANNPEIRGTHVIAGPTKTNFRDFVLKINKIRRMEKTYFYIPSFFLKPFVLLYESFSKEPIITVSQIENMDRVRVYDIEKNKILFDYSPTELDKGLRKSIVS